MCESLCACPCMYGWVSVWIHCLARCCFQKFWILFLCIRNLRYNECGSFLIFRSQIVCTQPKKYKGTHSILLLIFFNFFLLLGKEIFVFFFLFMCVPYSIVQYRFGLILEISVSAGPDKKRNEICVFLSYKKAVHVCHKYVKKKERINTVKYDTQIAAVTFMIFLIMRLKQRPGTEFKHKRKRTASTRLTFLLVCWILFSSCLVCVLFCIHFFVVVFCWFCCCCYRCCYSFKENCCVLKCKRNRPE